MNHLYAAKSSIHGMGLFSKKAIQKGKKIGFVQGDIKHVKRFNKKLAKESEDWMGVGRYTWIDTENSPFKHINHSCEPNSYVKGRKTVIALNDIKPGEEITLDYSLNESDPDWSIKSCRCKKPSCRKIIEPIQNLPKKVFVKKEAFIPTNFRKIFEVEQRRKRA